MVDYKPQFRPIYGFSGNSSSCKLSLADRLDSFCDNISDAYYSSFKDKSGKEILEDYVITSANDARTIVKAVKNNKAYAGALIAAVSLSALANYTEARDADIQGYTSNLIEFRSLVAELGAHAFVAAAAFIGISKYDGKTWSNTFRELFDISCMSIPISVLIYPPIRNSLADSFMEGGMIPEKATLWSQITLTLPYYAAVIYSKANILPKIKSYFRNKKSKRVDSTNIELKNNSKLDSLEKIITTKGTIEKAS